MNNLSLKKQFRTSKLCPTDTIERVVIISLVNENRRRELKQFFRLKHVRVVAVENIDSLWKYASCRNWRRVLRVVTEFALISDITSSKDVRSVLRLLSDAEKLRTFVLHANKIEESFLVERFIDRHNATLERVSVTCQFGRRYFPSSCKMLIDYQILPVTQTDDDSCGSTVSDSSDDSDSLVQLYQIQRWRGAKERGENFHFDYNAYNCSASADEDDCVRDSCSRIHIRVRQRRHHRRAFLSDNLVAWIVTRCKADNRLQSLYCALPIDSYVERLLRARLPFLKNLSLLLTQENDAERLWLLFTHCLPSKLETLEVSSLVDDTRFAIKNAISCLDVRNLFVKINGCVNEDYVASLLRNKENLEKLKLDFLNVEGTASVLKQLQKCYRLSELWLSWNANVAYGNDADQIFDPLLKLTNLKSISVTNFADVFDKSLSRLVQFHPTLLLVSCSLTWHPHKAVTAAEKRSSLDSFCLIATNEMESFDDTARYTIICSRAEVDVLPFFELDSITTKESVCVSSSLIQQEQRQQRCLTLRQILAEQLIKFENVIRASVNFYFQHIFPVNL